MREDLLQQGKIPTTHFEGSLIRERMGGNEANAELEIESGGRVVTSNL